MSRRRHTSCGGAMRCVLSHPRLQRVQLPPFPAWCRLIRQWREEGGVVGGAMYKQCLSGFVHLSVTVGTLRVDYTQWRKAETLEIASHFFDITAHFNLLILIQEKCVVCLIMQNTLAPTTFVLACHQLHHAPNLRLKKLDFHILMNLLKICKYHQTHSVCQ